MGRTGTEAQANKKTETLKLNGITIDLHWQADQYVSYGDAIGHERDGSLHAGTALRTGERRRLVDTCQQHGPEEENQGHIENQVLHSNNEKKAVICCDSRFLSPDAAVLWSVLALLHRCPDDASHCRQVDAEILRNLPITIGAGGVSIHNSSIPLSVMCGNVPKRWRGWSALRLRNGQRVAFNFRLGLHTLHECLITQIDLLAQSLPNAPSDTVLNKLLIVLTGLLPLGSELTQQTDHRQPFGTGACPIIAR